MILYKKNEITLKILDEVNCVFINLHPDHINHLVDKYALLLPQARYSPKFQFGDWDGKIKFFSPTGKTYNYLISQIIPIIYSFGYSIRLIDDRKAKLANIPQINENYFSAYNDEYGDTITLRPYQIEAINVVTDANGGIIVAGTGSGKTLINAAIVKLYRIAGFKTITIVPNTNLIRQTMKVFKQVELEVGEYSGSKKDLNHPNIVSTWQALQNIPQLISSYDVAIIDECHGVKAQVLKKILSDNGSKLPYRFGLTGTMPDNKLDTLSVNVALGEVKYTVPASDLIKAGFLATPHIAILQLEEDLQTEYQEYLETKKSFPTDSKLLTYKQFKKESFADFAIERDYLEHQEVRLEWIAGFLRISQKEGKGNVFCIVPTIKIGKKLAKLCDAKFVYGKDAVEVREEVFALFKDNDNILVIANAQIASVGIDINRIFHLVYVDLGKSFIRVIQTIGRGLRLAKDKDSILITDIGSDLPFSASHMRKRIKHYENAEYPYNKQIIRDCNVNF